MLGNYFNLSETETPYLDNFALHDINSRNIITNLKDVFIILFLFFLVFVLFLLFACCCGPHGYCSVKKRSFFFNAPIRLLLEIYYPVLVCSLINIKTSKLSNEFEIIAFIISWIMVIICLGFSAFSIWFLSKNISNLYENEELKERYEALYDEMDTSRKKALIYNIIFLVNRTALSFVLIYCTFNFYIQLWSFVVLNFLMLSYLVCIRPFLTKLKNNMEIFNETCIFLSSCTLFGFSR